MATEEKTREVTAKFKVASVSPSYGEQVNIQLLPDYNDGRNKEWSKYTPAGQISITVKDEVASAFPLGQAFRLTFTPED